MAHDEIKCFVFTDIVASTRLKSEMSGQTNVERDREFAGQILEPHRKKILAELDKFSGRMISTQGDGHFLVFNSPLDATLWAINVQQSHQEDPITTPEGGSVGIKIGIHWGQATIDPSDASNFIGRSIDFAARIVDFGSRGQILSSRTVSSLVESEEIFGVELFNHGNREMRGIGLKPVYEILYGGKQPSPLKDEGEVTLGTTEVSSPTDTVRTLRISSPGTQELHAGKRLGKYRLLREIGAGGMGKVYLAKHVGMDRTCVVKLIRSSLLRSGNEEIISRFYREIKILASIDHPHVVGAYDSSSENDAVHYLVMEYIDGVSLDKTLCHRDILSPADACEIVRQAAIGLQYIHEKGLVHRDIKPSNLMLVSKEGQPLVKVLDLGLALLINDAGNRITQVEERAMGTGHYMAPEQWKSTNVDIRADIYSLGCTLYHLIAGKPPFEGSRFTQQHAHQNVSPPSMEQIEGISDRVQAILLQMMAKNPDDRFAIPSEVVDALAEPASKHHLAEVFSRAYSSDSAPPETIAHKTPPNIAPSAETLPHSLSLSKVADNEPDMARPWWKRRSLWALFGLLLVAGIVGGLFFTRSTDHAGMSAAKQQQLSDDLGTLPGLNGDWWFKETPWYVPGVRQKFLESIESGQTEIDKVQFSDLLVLARNDDVVTLHLQLRAASKKLGRLIENRGEKAAATRLLEIDPEDMSEKDFETMLADQAENLAGVTTATGRHLRAVLLHRLSQYQEAKAEYDQAIALYEESNAPSKNRLLAVCHADLAQLHLEIKQYESCTEETNLARDQITNREVPPAFAASCYLIEAQAWRQQNQLNSADVKLDEAARILEGDRDSEEALPNSNKAPPLSPLHPLGAAVHEQRARIMLDRWKLNDAINRLNQAVAVREKNQALPSGNPRCERYLLFYQQLKATAEHFRGNQTEAIQGYTFLLNSIQDSIDSPKTTNRQLVELKERRPNLYERLGDCALFGTPRDVDRARDYYLEMIESAQAVNFQTDHRWPHMCRVRFKIALSALLDDDLEQARNLLEEAEAMYAFREALNEGQSRQYQDAERVAMAAFGLHHASSEVEKGEGIQSLLAHLDSIQPDNPRHVNRNSIRMLLMEFELLFSSEQLHPEDAITLSRKLQEIGRGIVRRSNREFSGIYFQPYYEAARNHLEHAADSPQVDAAVKERLEKERDNIDGLLNRPEALSLPSNEQAARSSLPPWLLLSR